MNVNAYLLVIILISILIGIGLGNLLKSSPAIYVIKNVTSSCYMDLDCNWVITNCCPESSGAKWECVNMKEFKPKDCPEHVICPQVISPKPSLGCVCKEGKCVVE